MGTEPGPEPLDLFLLENTVIHESSFLVYFGNFPRPGLHESLFHRNVTTAPL
jgi:hypothetical protein